MGGAGNPLPQELGTELEKDSAVTGEGWGQLGAGSKGTDTEPGCAQDRIPALEPTS